MIPADQGDPTRVAQLVARLISLGIEVHRAAGPVSLKDGSYPAGTYVVRLDQPYRNYAVDLLTPSFFAKDAGEPYDDVSWELPAHYHLKAIPTADPRVRAANLTLLGAAPHPTGEISGTGPVYVLKDTGQEGLLEARFKLARFKVSVAERSFNMGGDEYPAGSWILAAQAGLAGAVQDVAGQLGLNFVAVGAAPGVASHVAPVPRLGVWVPWADTDTIGWLRYSLDQRHIPYTYVRDEDVRAGKLHEKYDVLLYGHVDLELAEQIQGIPRAWGPMAFKKTRATPSLGTPAESDDITGGGGLERVGRGAAVRRFGWTVDYVGEWVDVGARGWNCAGGSPGGWRCASEYGGGWGGGSRGGERCGDEDAGGASAGDVCEAGASYCVWVCGAYAGVQAELCVVCAAAAVVADGVLHDVFGWAG